MTNEKIRRPIIDEKSILRLKKELEHAKKPIILIGAGANRKRITKYLWAFIHKYDMPFLLHKWENEWFTRKIQNTIFERQHLRVMIIFTKRFQKQIWYSQLGMILSKNQRIWDGEGMRNQNDSY